MIRQQVTSAVTLAGKLLCVSTAPFDRPVVPDV